MYNTDFDIKRARYVVVLKRNYFRYRNGINTWNNQEYMESMYGAYAYSHVSESTLIYISKSYELITRVAEWNGTPYKLSYLYPILKIDKEYNCCGKRQYRKRFHTKSRSYLLETKREAISGSDPEVKQYLSMRQRNRNHCLNYSGLRNNRNNVPGDWKHYNKCRKQWAKNIRNPSYEKLSKAVWKQKLKEIEADENCT